MTKAFTLPKTLASADSLQKTLYRMANICTWDVQENEGEWIVSLTTQKADSPEKLEAEFKNILIDYSLREKIRSETEHIRALLFAHAFSNVTNPR
jgi:His-Xaa-Ser system protein HxsD